MMKGLPQDKRPRGNINEAAVQNRILDEAAVGSEGVKKMRLVMKDVEELCHLVAGLWTWWHEKRLDTGFIRQSIGMIKLGGGDPYRMDTVTTSLEKQRQSFVTYTAMVSGRSRTEHKHVLTGSADRGRKRVARAAFERAGSR